MPLLPWNVNLDPATAPRDDATIVSWAQHSMVIEQPVSPETAREALVGEAAQLRLIPLHPGLRALSKRTESDFRYDRLPDNVLLTGLGVLLDREATDARRPTRPGDFLGSYALMVTIDGRLFLHEYIRDLLFVEHEGPLEGAVAVPRPFRRFPRPWLVPAGASWNVTAVNVGPVPDAMPYAFAAPGSFRLRLRVHGFRVAPEDVERVRAALDTGTPSDGAPR